MNTIGKIDLLQNTANDKELIESEADFESSNLKAVKSFLLTFGIRRSVNAIQSAVDTPYKKFSIKEAVSSLQSLGFKASFGSISLRQISKDLLPMIAYMKSGEAVIIQRYDEENNLITERFGETNKLETTSLRDFDKTYSGYAIIAKELSEQEKKDLNGHWFFSAFNRSKWIYFQVAIAALVSNFLSLSVAIFTMTTYDRIIPNSAFESLIALGIGVAIALSFDFIIKTLRAKFIDLASKRADLSISKKLFDRILQLTPTEQLQKTGATANTVKEFESLRDFFNSSTMVILVDLPFVIFFIYVISLISGPLAYVHMVAVPAVIIVAMAAQPFLARVTKGSVENSMNKQAILIETLNGLETVNATGSGKLMRKRYEEAMLNQTESGNKIRAISTFVINFAASAQQYAQVGAIVFGVFLIADGTITQGALIATIILGGRAMAPLSQFASTLSRANGAITAYKNLNKLIGKRDHASQNLPISRPNLDGAIEFKNVTFKFPDANQPTISNLSLKIPSGQNVAILGKMGSGKSTLSKLIAGTLTPSEGAVLIDGVDVRQIDKADIQKNIGVMLQENWLFSGTIRENIQVGFFEYDDNHILNICKIAGVDEFVGSNPEGYDMKIHERGIGLSGGQKQSVNLARSLLHHPQILLLDEPTSSMDQATEKKILESLKRFCLNRTSIIVTHRNSILSMVDRVLILENGQIIADQTPAQLGLKKGDS